MHEKIQSFGDNKLRITKKNKNIIVKLKWKFKGNDKKKKKKILLELSEKAKNNFVFPKIILNPSKINE